MREPSFDHRSVITQNLVGVRAARGRVPLRMQEALGEMLGVNPRTLRRWVRKGAPPAPNPKAESRFRLCEDSIALYMEMNGNVTATRRAMIEREFPAVPSRRTLQRAVDRLPAATRATAKHGTMARRNHEPYVRMKTGGRNEVWQTDHKLLDIFVMPPVGTRPVRPWLTIFIDDFTRVVTGYVVGYDATAASVIAGLHAAVRIDPDWGPFGGVPQTIVCDQGKDFLAQSVAEVALTLGTDLRPLAPYHPWLKGKVERFNRTIDQKFVGLLPGYTHGPTRNDNTLYGPSGHMTDAEFRRQLHEAIHSYNHAHAHRELGDLTPAEMWDLDPTPIWEMADEDLAWMMRPSKEAMVRRGAIQFMKTRFVHPLLTNLDGERVVIRYTPHDNRAVDVFVDGQFLCEATAQDLLTPEGHQAILDARSQERRQDQVRRRVATNQQRVRLRPMNGTEPAEIARNLTRDEAREEQDGRRGRSRRADEGIDQLLADLDGAALNLPLEDAR